MMEFGSMKILNSVGSGGVNDMGLNTARRQICEWLNPVFQACEKRCEGGEAK
jgi:hypothetical protein